MSIDIAALRELASLQIERILDSLDVPYRDKYHSYVAACPVHGGDRKDAFSWHIERGIWKCFSRGCEKEFGADIFGLVRGIQQASFPEAVEYVKRFVNLEISAEEIKSLKESRSNRDFILTQKKKVSRAKIFSPELLKRLEHHDYLASRGFDPKVIEEYHIGACLQPDMYMSGRIVIPVCDIDGNIIGFTGRTLDSSWESKAIPKWKHSIGPWKEGALFNIHKAAKFIKELGKAVVCEGPLDVLKLEQSGIHNGVALLGKDIHGAQISLLIRAGAIMLVSALDNDKAGQAGTSNLVKKAGMLFDVKVLKIPQEYKDIGDMPAEAVRALLGGVGCCLA